jgi:rubrerythrin
MLLEAILAGVVALAVLWLVLQPIVAPETTTESIYEPLDAEETARGRALLALKEIEFDRATAKLSDEDYAQLKARYEAAAVSVLAGCAVCGAAMDEADRHCGGCGARREQQPAGGS